DVTTKALSMGICSIMKSKEIVLMALGESKAHAFKGMIEGPVTNHLPASVLQNNANLVVTIDEEEASKL
ncbi:glucosamine-6-phosphate deaminase, partial [Enterococcus faecium]